MINWSNRLIEAKDFARLAHAGQVRKYTGESYIFHPLEVAEIVSEYTDDEDVIIAAIHHDLLEDTKVLVLDIYERFGGRVTEFVEELTDFYTSEIFPNQNRAWRKAQEAARIATISNESKLIKMADLFSNTKSIVEHDPNFARVYLREKTVVM